MTSTSPDKIVIAPYVATASCSEYLFHHVWNHVPTNEISKYWSGEPAPAHRHATAQVCWTDESLIVRFVCVQREPLVISEDPITESKTLKLWDRDVCEIFLAPDPSNTSRYFEFEAAPTGEWVDLGIQITATGRETNWDYKSGMSATAQLEEETLTVGMKIPWSEYIPKPQVRNEWRVNLFRCVGPESPTRYLAWQPTHTPEPNFHVPDAFGWLRFT